MSSKIGGIETTSISKQNSKKGMKRKRRVSPEEQFETERLERYNKLVHMATKALHKEAKVVKSFECQKIVRRLKQSQSTQDEEKLTHVKAFSLQHVERVCLQRLGVPNLNPQPQEEKEKNVFLEKEDERLVERMLLHKRMVSAMETWNDKVTEYRRWLLKRQERVSSAPTFASDKTSSKKQKKQSSDGGMFVCLGGGSMEEMTEGYYGPGEDYEEDEYTARKKNRPGQRARKAKAVAIQAKKEGRTLESSVNWREKKQKPHDDTDTQEEESKQPKAPAPAAEIATMGKTWKEEGKEHPSWAASQSQKAGIVEFKGKKITFD